MTVIVAGKVHIAKFVMVSLATDGATSCTSCAIVLKKEVTFFVTFWVFDVMEFMLGSQLDTLDICLQLLLIKLFKKRI